MDMLCDNWQKHGEDAKVPAVMVYNDKQLCEECLAEAMEEDGQ